MEEFCVEGRQEECDVLEGIRRKNFVQIFKKKIIKKQNATKDYLNFE